VNLRRGGKERIPVVTLDDHDALARAVAERIAHVIRSRAAQGRYAVLGLATGATPVGVYRELIRMHREEGLSFAKVVTFNLDEYYPIARDSLQSYHRFMWENLFAHVDIAPENVHIPRGDLPREAVAVHTVAYEEAIKNAGGIDFQLLGIGKTGHIGFNEPGSGLASRTRLVTLDTITRRDAAADFFGEESVPREAVTMGVATILDAKKSLSSPLVSTRLTSLGERWRERSTWMSLRRSSSSTLTQRSISTPRLPPR
jgi:glucosamine-6-phosphate deaminase